MTLDLVQGTLDMLILRALSHEQMHGYGISEWLRTRSDGALGVGDAALYKALRRLEARGWVEAEWGASANNRRARYYELTARGRRQLRTESSQFRRYADAVFKILGPAGDDA